MIHPLRRLIGPILILIYIIIAGVFGYVIVEKVPFVDALYMVVITVSTVGFREVIELSVAGKLLTMGLILFGVGTVAYTAGQVVELIMEGQIVGFRRRQVMEKRIAELKDHYIICGFGRVGKQVAEDFQSEKTPFVVIDSRPEITEELEGSSLAFIVGDIASDEILEKAGIRKAKGIIASADSDAANVFVTLSARVLNPEIYIVARSASKDSENKLRKAGANRVLTPYLIAGRRMAAMVQKPIAIDFLDTVMHSEHLHLALREFAIPEKSRLVAKTLAETKIRQKSGATVLAIRSKDGSFNLQPIGSSKIEMEDILITIGTQEQLDLLEKMIKWS
ncbi:potassium channel family protein [Candidatus Margulisiibacteriota bacterium]